jgi:hypothetical protein
VSNLDIGPAPLESPMPAAANLAPTGLNFRPLAQRQQVAQASSVVVDGTDALFRVDHVEAREGNVARTIQEVHAGTRQGMKGPDRGENSDKLDTAGARINTSYRRKVVAAQRIWVCGSPGARTPNLRINSLRTLPMGEREMQRYQPLSRHRDSPRPTQAQAERANDPTVKGPGKGQARSRFFVFRAYPAGGPSTLPGRVVCRWSGVHVGA